MFTSTRRGAKFVELLFNGAKQGPNWEQWVLLRSDAHWDHPSSDLSAQERHLNQALERKAPIIDVGDLFCGMQFPKDPRVTKGSTRPEHEYESYYDRLVRTAAQWHAPYAKLWAAQFRGNHESGIRKHAGTDLSERFVYALNQHGGRAELMGYEGYIRLRVQFTKTRTDSVLLWCTHGGRGRGAHRSKGVLNVDLRAAAHPDANIIVSGDIHREWMATKARTRVTAQGREYRDEQLHIQLSSYKDNVTGVTDSWEIEHEFEPTPVGAAWIRLWLDSGKSGARLRFDVMRAK